MDGAIKQNIRIPCSEIVRGRGAVKKGMMKSSDGWLVGW